MDFLKSNGGSTIEELEETFTISQSTVHRHLNTLESHGYVIQERDTYHVGLRALELARYARERKKAYEIADDITKAIATETEDRSTFITEEHGKAIILSTEIGEHGIFADINIGQRVHLHASAVGKAMLAQMPRERVDEILDLHGMPARTENTITDRDELYTELDEIERRGYAINYAERIDGVRAVGVAVEDSDGPVIGAFGVSGPTRRMSDERISGEISEFLLNAAEEFELRNRYSETS